MNKQNRIDELLKVIPHCKTRSEAEEIQQEITELEEQTWTVVMKSEVYGEATFEYDSEDEAEKGMKRLKKIAKAYEKIDGIKREVYVQ